jgi:putative addiction module CopG family antidote
MEIHLKPELEELIKQDVQRGSCQNVDESVESAVSMLHEQEVGSAENRLEIAAKIDEGHASAQHGELEAADFVRCRMSEMQPDRRTCRAKDEQLSVHASSRSGSFRHLELHRERQSTGGRQG